MTERTAWVLIRQGDSRIDWATVTVSDEKPHTEGHDWRWRPCKVIIDGEAEAGK